MKNKIIRISDINDIDKSKISVYDLNNRYIDSKGNLYGLKFNIMNKKIDIIKLMRTHTEDASHIQQEMLRKKISQKSLANLENKNHEGANPDYTDDELLDQERTSPESIIENILAIMKTHASRFRGIINNITNSNAFPRENKSDNIELQDIFRSIELDGVQKIDKIANYHTELTSYPRSISYYQSKLDKKGREIIDRITGNNEKIMRFISCYEMLNAIKDLYTNLKIFIVNLEKFITKKNAESQKVLSTVERQYLQDAEISISTTIDEINQIFEDMTTIEEFISDPVNL